MAIHPIVRFICRICSYNWDVSYKGTSIALFSTKKSQWHMWVRVSPEPPIPCIESSHHWVAWIAWSYLLLLVQCIGKLRQQKPVSWFLYDFYEAFKASESTALRTTQLELPSKPLVNKPGFHEMLVYRYLPGSSKGRWMDEKGCRKAPSLGILKGAPFGRCWYSFSNHGSGKLP